jgi:hypothetical protein
MNSVPQWIYIPGMVFLIIMFMLENTKVGSFEG